MGMISHIEDEILELEDHELRAIKIIVDNELRYRDEQKRIPIISDGVKAFVEGEI